MDDQVLMRMLHRRAHVGEETQPRADVQPVIVAVGGDAAPVHILHDQIGTSVGGESAIEQPRDLRVDQSRKNLPFGEEPLVQWVVGVGRVNQLDGDTLLELAVGSLGEVDDTHAAAAELADHSIRTDSTWKRIAEGLCNGRQLPSEAVGDAGLRIRHQQRAHLLDELRIATGVTL